MTTITIEAGAARFLAEALLPATSKDDVTPVLTGVHLSIENGKLRAVATDRYRVHAVLLDVVGDAPAELNALIPRSIMQWIVRATAAYTRRRAQPFKPVVVFEIDEDGSRALIRAREDAEANLEEQTITTALIKGNFPPVMRLIATARTADTADAAEGMLNLDFVSSLKALGSTPPVIRFTKAENPHREGVVHFWFGDHAEALIQPNIRLDR